MAVITISRQFGAGGRTLGRMIGKKLNYRFLDDLILQEIDLRKMSALIQYVLFVHL